MVYATSLTIDIMQMTNQERIKHILDALKLKYQWRDLYNDQQTKKKFMEQIDQFGGVENIPIILINDIYIGGINEL